MDIQILKSGALKVKLIRAFIAVGLIPLALMAVLALSSVNSAITNQVYAKLESTRDAKKDAIEAYSNQIIRQVQTLSSSPEVIAGILKFKAAYGSFTDDANFNPLDNQRNALAAYYEHEFGRAYQAKNPQSQLNFSKLVDTLPATAIALQYAYIVNNAEALGEKQRLNNSSLGTDYDKVHAYYHPGLRQYLEAFDYYDIFLVDSETGDVIYSVFKELDFATNLREGNYANTGLAEAFQKASKLNSPNDYVLVDYKRYTPSYEAPASFIASPIFSGDRQLGVLVFQMPLDQITSVMNQRSGMGITGEAYLVGHDRLMRSDSYKHPNNYSVDASFRSQKVVTSEAISHSLLGESGILHATNYAGEDVLTGYAPVDFGPLSWALMVDIESKEAFASVTDLLRIVAILALLVVMFVVAIALKFSKSLDAPVSKREAFFRAITETAEDPILLIDEFMTLEFVNPVTAKIFDYSDIEMLGNKLEMLIPDYTSISHLNAGLDGEVIGLTKGGKQVSLAVSFAKVDLSDQYLQYACILHDISKFKSLERELSHSQKMESVGQLAAGIAHEINTPTQFVSDNLLFLQESVNELFELIEAIKKSIETASSDETYVKQITQFLQAADLEYLIDEVPSALTQSSEGMQRVATIVRAMKDYSHPGGNMEFSDLNTAIQSTITVSCNEWKYHAQMETSLDENLPAIPCLVSEVKQVILNMIVNAAHAIVDKYGEDDNQQGLISISSSVSHEHALIEISDNGAGMTQDVKEKIFDPFFTTKEVGKGTGQGLSIAHRIIVEKHGGKLDIESTPGVGTRFLIYLPLQPNEAS